MGGRAYVDKAGGASGGDWPARECRTDGDYRTRDDHWSHAPKEADVYRAVAVSIAQIAMANTRSPRTWIGFLAAAPALTLLALWGGGPSATPAQAQGIPDSGAQNERIIDQLKATNEKLDRLITLLGDGKLQVTLRKTDEADRNR